VRDGVVGLVEDLESGAFVVGLPVGRVVVLIGVEVSIGICFVNFPALDDGTVGAGAGIGEDEISTIGARRTL
jgi:hypothetical protein